MKKILIVCVGNICRSPVAEQIMKTRLPDMEISSAGISAVIGHDIDATARGVAEENGLMLAPHQARQFTPEIGDEHDLILVLEAGHKREIERRSPQLSGRIFKLSHWTGGEDISDPFRLDEEFHQRVFEQMREAAIAWASRLQSMKRAGS